MATPINTLELRETEIPRSSSIIEAIERELGRPLTHEHRHYLAGEPVHCGDILELYRNGEWLEGRYEWNPRLDEQPTLETSVGTFWLDDTRLLRWPSQPSPRY